MTGTTGPLLFGILLAMFTLLCFAAAWRLLGKRDPVGARLQQLTSGELAAEIGSGFDEGRRRAVQGANRMLSGLGRGPGLAAELAAADMSLTVGEFLLVVFGVALLGFLVGVWRVGLLLGIPLGAVCGYLPVMYMHSRQARRKRAFTEQLPDVLALLIGALRAGYGLSQALEMLVERLQPPAQTEFARVMRGVGLGLPVQRALNDMADRVDSDDLYLVMTAINVQYEIGGNLAQTLEIIADTVRDRIRIRREIRVFTAQQRFTGYILALLPIILAIGFFLINPTYMGRLFAPGLIRLVPIATLILQVAGFLVIRKILDIEV